MSLPKTKLHSFLFGDKAFYRAVLVIILPVIVQNGVSNFVSMLDNLMVGALGDNEMSGVAVANQLLFIFQLAIFGGLSGPGIFTSQYHGAKDQDGIRYTLRIKLLIAAAICLVGITVLAVWQNGLIGLFLKGEAESSEAADPALILSYAKDYLNILFLGLPPLAIAFAYSSTMRECGDALWPMIASLAAVFVNMMGNWLLIFGNLGCPKLGVSGAAIATVASRYVEMGIVMLRSHLCPKKYPYITGTYTHFRLPGKLTLHICKTGFPLLANELLWSTAMTALNMIYSLCGISVMGAISINSTINNLFSVVAYSMGTATAVMIGHDLGAGRFETAKQHSHWLLSFGEMLAVTTSALLILGAGTIVSLYSGVSDQVRELAVQLLRITAIATPIGVCNNVCYFAIRSGGRTDLTFLFDCGYSFFITMPLAYLLVKVFHLDILPTFAIVNFTNISKCIIGLVMMKKGIWLKNITQTDKS